MKTLKFVGRPVSHKALSSAALLRGRPDGVVVNTSALESRYIYIYIYIYIYMYIYIYIYIYIYLYLYLRYYIFL